MDRLEVVVADDGSPEAPDPATAVRRARGPSGGPRLPRRRRPQPGRAGHPGAGPAVPRPGHRARAVIRAPHGGGVDGIRSRGGASTACRPRRLGAVAGTRLARGHGRGTPRAGGAALAAGRLRRQRQPARGRRPLLPLRHRRGAGRSPASCSTASAGSRSRSPGTAVRTGSSPTAVGSPGPTSCTCRARWPGTTGRTSPAATGSTSASSTSSPSPSRHSSPSRVPAGAAWCGPARRRHPAARPRLGGRRRRGLRAEPVARHRRRRVARQRAPARRGHPRARGPAGAGGAGAGAGTRSTSANRCTSEPVRCCSGAMPHQCSPVST